MRMFSPENVPMPAAMEEAEDAKMENELATFVLDGHYTGKQVCEAYYQIVGIADNEPDQAVEEIRAKMQALHEAGLNYTRLAKVVALKERSEYLLQKYHEYIDKLDVTEQEKQELASIVDKQRSGHIECRIDGVLESELDVVGVGQSKERLASEIMNSIRYILAKSTLRQKYKFSFEEK